MGECCTALGLTYCADEKVTSLVDRLVPLHLLRFISTQREARCKRESLATGGKAAIAERKKFLV